MKSRSADPVARLRLWLPLLAVTSTALILPAPARAGLVVSVQSVSAPAGAFDVTLTNTGPSAVTVNGFSFKINSSSSQVSFSDATIFTTTAPYIFDGNSLFGPTISQTSGQSLLASDIDVDTAGTSLAAGATLGLGHVAFTVTGVLSSPVTVSLSPSPDTSLNGPPPVNVIPIDALQSGTISPAGGIVPEPSSLMCAALGLPIGAWLVRHWRRRLGTAAA